MTMAPWMPGQQDTHPARAWVAPAQVSRAFCRPPVAPSSQRVAYRTERHLTIASTRILDRRLRSRPGESRGRDRRTRGWQPFGASPMGVRGPSLVHVIGLDAGRRSSSSQPWSRTPRRSMHAPWLHRHRPAQSSRRFVLTAAVASPIRACLSVPCVMVTGSQHRGGWLGVGRAPRSSPSSARL